MPERRKLALHAHGLAVFTACGTTLSTELFAFYQFVTTFVTAHRSCGFLLFTGVLLRELRHQGGEFRCRIEGFWLARQGVSHKAGHQLAGLHMLLDKATGLGKIELNRSGDAFICEDR